MTQFHLSVHQATDLQRHIDEGGQLIVVIHAVQLGTSIAVGPCVDLESAMRVVADHIPVDVNPDSLMYVPDIIPLIGVDQ